MGIVCPFYRQTKLPFASYFQSLDGQNRQSPIASDFGSRTQIAALFAIFAVSECLKRIANRAFRIAVSNRKDASDSNRAFFKSLAILDLDRAISPI